MSVKFPKERFGIKVWTGLLQGRRSNLINWYFESQIGEEFIHKTKLLVGTVLFLRKNGSNYLINL